MKYSLLFLLLLGTIKVSAQTMTVYKSSWPVEETVDRIRDVIDEKQLVAFKTINHDELARQHGVEIPPTRVILFEEPSLMAELVSCRQTTAIDLPMKILVWEENEDVYIGFFDPKLMKKRFMFNECDDILASMSRILIRIVNEALKEG